MTMYSPNLTRVLVVDDDPDILAVSEIALSTVGGLVTQSCSGGREAIERGPAFRPDLIMLDSTMPGMDGAETLRAMRSLDALADVPIVFFTARAMRHEIERFAALGAVGMVAKPFDPMTLATDLRKLWAYCRKIDVPETGTEAA